MNLENMLRLRGPSLRRSLLSGVAASTAYLLEQAVDMRLTHNRYDDLVLWGGMVSRQPRRQRLIGLLGHYFMGTALAFVYDVARPSLPQMPGWLRGLIFVQLENTLLFPLVAAISAVHPAVRRGDLPPLWTWRYFRVEVVRHLAYGAVLGWLNGEEE